MSEVDRLLVDTRTPPQRARQGEIPGAIGRRPHGPGMATRPDVDVHIREAWITGFSRRRGAG